MKELKEYWKKQVSIAVNSIARVLNRAADFEYTEIKADSIVVENPPNPEMGDMAFPMFQFSKLLKKNPKEIALLCRDELLLHIESVKGQPVVSGPYLNIKLNRVYVAETVIKSIKASGAKYGEGSSLNGRRITIEFSCPNTNKPLHLGHLRNDAIGMSLSNIFKVSGATVRKVNLINDRGIHICKSMLAYMEFGEGSTPESEGIKGDHFVGKYYVLFNSWASKDLTAEPRAREMLKNWEKGDKEVIALWKKMNRWAIDGISETYRATGVEFDKIYFESETYKLGKEDVLKGLERGVFYREADGSIWVDLFDYGLDKKVLLRSDGTSLYLTQDIGTAVQRYKDWPFDKLIYVVASEQNYHFKVLFRVLKILGYNWADNLFHLAYGMVNLPEGKMKSREGKVVDADDLLIQLKNLAKNEIISKGRDSEIKDLDGTAESIALGALNYYLLQVSPYKDMIFFPEESISFTGNTGPYLQYMGARISSVLRKYKEGGAKYSGGVFNPQLLNGKEEWELMKMLGYFPELVENAADEKNPSLIAVYLYELAKHFSRFYHDNPILHNDDRDTIETRMELAMAVLQVLKNGLKLISVPFLDRM